MCGVSPVDTADFPQIVERMTRQLTEAWWERERRAPCALRLYYRQGVRDGQLTEVTLAESSPGTGWTPTTAGPLKAGWTRARVARVLREQLRTIPLVRRVQL
jgi:hypothetical protein